MLYNNKEKNIGGDRVDLILINGKIHTMDLSIPEAEAVAVNGNKIYKVGSNAEILSLKDENTRAIDLKGRVLVPGFNDSHMHLLGFGYFLNMVDLSHCKSIEEIIQKTKEFIETKTIEKGSWVRGR